MSKPRKTVEVAPLVEWANNYLANYPGPSEGRRAVALFTETILCDANAYNGWIINDSEWDSEKWAPIPDYDDTRRHYRIKGEN